MKNIIAIAALSIASLSVSAQTMEWDKRFESKPVFEGTYYLDQNRDVAVAGAKPGDHWKAAGLQEGRVSSPVFDVKYYLMNNKDLQDAFGQVGYDKAAKHWLDAGIAEGRKSHPNFDVKYYADNNLDLKANFGSDYRKYVDHYLEYGWKENRVTVAPAAKPAQPETTKPAPTMNDRVTVSFAYAKFDLNSADKAKLDQMAMALKQSAVAKVKIEGHADSSGDAGRNQTLSENRANAVKDYLVMKGIDASRITTSGKGSDVPVGDNATDAGRAQNRRAEIALTR